MDQDAKQKLQAYLKDALEKHGDTRAFSDDESIFVSGRLDSFSMLNLVMYLEEAFGIDFSSFEFDVSLLDSVRAIEVFVEAKSPRS